MLSWRSTGKGKKYERKSESMDESGFGASNQDGSADGGGDDRDGGGVVFGGLEDGRERFGTCRGAVPFDFGRRTAGGAGKLKKRPARGRRLTGRAVFCRMFAGIAATAGG